MEQLIVIIHHIAEKFEPGESRDTFEVDFSSEFGQEADTKSKQKALKRKRNEAFDEDEDGEGLAERYNIQRG